MRCKITALSAWVTHFRVSQAIVIVFSDESIVLKGSGQDLNTALSQQDVDNILSRLRSKSAEIQKSSGKLDGLLDIRAAMVDHPPLDFAPYVDDHTLAALYLIRKLIADVWVNLGTDATFDLESIEKEMKDFAIQLAKFLQLALAGEKENPGQTWLAYSELVRSYTRALGSVEKRIFLGVEKGR